MDSVIMTSPGNSSRLRSRLRSAANAICARTSKPKSASNRNTVSRNGRNSLSRNNSIHRSNSVHKHFNNNSTRGNGNSAGSNVNHDRNANNNEQLVQSGSPRLLQTLFIVGKLAREVYSAWCGRLGPATHIPEDSVQALFNDMHIYPSKAQVYEMLQCARMCGGRMAAVQNGAAAQYLTFGEFCVFAGELRRHMNSRLHNNTGRSENCIVSTTNDNGTQVSKYEVFLGGSCNPTTWRADIAIPTLANYGITYYNPQVSTWSPELLAAEHKAKQSANVLLFVLDSETRCVAGMVEVAQLSAAQRCLVVVALTYNPRQLISNETISHQEFLDLWHGQNTLLALVRREVTPVFTTLTPALDCTARLLRQPTMEFDCIGELHLSEKLRNLRKAFDSVDRNKTGELTLRDVCSAYHTVTKNTLSLSDLKLIVRNNEHAGVDDERINFEQFCGIVAEFSTNGCYTSSPRDEWANQPLQRQYSANNNTSYSDVDNDTENSCHNTLYNAKSPNINTADLRDIYLGGSCLHRTSWRQSVAIPMLTQHNLSFYNPILHEKYIGDILTTNSENGSDHLSSDDDMSVDESDDILIQNIKNSIDIEADVANDVRLIESSRVLLFVITNTTRSIAPMLLAAHCIGKKYNVVLCVQQLANDTCFLGNEELTKYAIKDYNRSRTYLSDMAKREGIVVFESIHEAVKCAVERAIRR